MMPNASCCAVECVYRVGRMGLQSGGKRLGSRMRLLCEQAEHVGIYS